jgi:uncharacterized damage-inducible protein DinB
VDLQILKAMLETHFWANRTMLDALEKLTEEQYRRPFESSFKSIELTAIHIMKAEEFLLAGASGADVHRTRPEEVPTLAALRARWAELEGRWRSFIEGLTEEGLRAPCTVRFASGEQFTLQVWQVIHQFMVHAPYHRGQVVTLLRQVGAPTFKTDALQYHIARI